MDSQTRKALHALANSADGLFAVGADYRITFWSEAAQAILGYAPGEVLGRPCHQVVQGKDNEGAIWCQQDCPVMRRLREGKAISNYDIQTRRKDGRPVWLNISIVPLPQGGGLPYTPVHLFRDITVRKAKERLGERVTALVLQTSCTSGDGMENQPVPRGPLSQREFQVLSLLARGYSTDSVARNLGVQKVTVQNHIQRILSKLGVHSRTEAIAWLYRRRLGAPETLITPPLERAVSR